MAKPTYWELLKHPNWQRKRLEVMQRDNFTCVSCGSTENTLNVHHSYYTKGAMPWDYPADSLKTLCQQCHGDHHEAMENLKASIGLLDITVLDMVRGYVDGLLWSEGDYSRKVHIESYEYAQGVGHWWGVSADDIIALVNSKGVISVDTLSDLETGFISASPEHKEPE
ncbi:MAG: hypothetical protein NUW22_05065 [Acidobacteria bacterium]|nr:hypothetical protein [Acidobacteriota bacterium]